MGMLEDLKKDVKAALYERLGNPLLRALVVTWLLWNWELLLVLALHDAQIDQRIEQVTTIYATQSRLVWYPLLSALTWTLVLPWLFNVINTVPHYATRKGREWKHWASGEPLHSKEQSEELVRAHNAALQKLAETEKLKTSDVSRLESELTARENQIRGLQDSLTAKEGERDKVREELTTLRESSGEDQQQAVQQIRQDLESNFKRAVGDLEAIQLRLVKQLDSESRALIRQLMPDPPKNEPERRAMILQLQEWAECRASVGDTFPILVVPKLEDLRRAGSRLRDGAAATSPVDEANLQSVRHGLGLP